MSIEGDDGEEDDEDEDYVDKPNSDADDPDEHADIEIGNDSEEIVGQELPLADLNPEQFDPDDASRPAQVRFLDISFWFSSIYYFFLLEGGGGGTHFIFFFEICFGLMFSFLNHFVCMFLPRYPMINFA